MKNTVLSIFGLIVLALGLAVYLIAYFSARSENKKKMEDVRQAKADKAKLRKMELAKEEEETETEDNAGTEDESISKQTDS